MKASTWFAATAIAMLLLCPAMAQNICPLDKDSEPQEVSVNNLQVYSTTVGACEGITLVDEKASWSKLPKQDSLGENESVSFGTTSFAYGILSGTGTSILSMETQMTPHTSSYGLQTEKLFSYGGRGAAVSESLYSDSGYPAYGNGIEGEAGEAFCAAAVTGFNSVMRSGAIGSTMNANNLLENGMLINYDAAFAPAIGSTSGGLVGSSTAFGSFSIIKSDVTTQYSKSVTMVGKFNMEHTFNYNSIVPAI